MVKLRHPATNQSAMFVFSPGDSTIQEVMTFDENKRSWFIDDNVRSDGKMHLSTPIDPLFLILPYLRKVIFIKIDLSYNIVIQINYHSSF